MTLLAGPLSLRLGGPWAVAQVTRQVELMTYVTRPTMRYHPAVVAQKAATLQLLADGRFLLGLGAGETSTST
ncbi:MAG TPA: LLM class flavin-dependent oxidoreductase [Lapillicoccus sp.]